MTSPRKASKYQNLIKRSCTKYRNVVNGCFSKVPFKKDSSTEINLKWSVQERREGRRGEGGGGLETIGVASDILRQVSRD